MLPEARREQIVQRAISVFAAQGFSASTRDLADALGVTQPLLYRYFPSKDDLIDRVFEEVFFRPWNPEWEVWLADRTTPLGDRLRRYLKDYATFITDGNLVRLHMYAGLTRPELTHRFISKLRSTHFQLIAQELRHEFGLAAPRDEAAAAKEIELIWAAHSSVFYLGIRRWVYALPDTQDVGQLVDLIVDNFLHGAPFAIRRIGEKQAHHQ